MHHSAIEISSFWGNHLFLLLSATYTTVCYKKWLPHPFYPCIVIVYAILLRHLWNKQRKFQTKLPIILHAAHVWVYVWIHIYFSGGWYSQASLDTFMYALSWIVWLTIKKGNLVDFYLSVCLSLPASSLSPHIQKNRNMLVWKGQKDNI